MYGWKITTDHLTAHPGGADDHTGLEGPHDITENTRMLLDTKTTPEEALPEGLERQTFEMYDDDGQTYYTGVIVWDADDDTEYFEDYLLAPLRDFGAPNAGAVRVHYHGRPEWDL